MKMLQSLKGVLACLLLVIGLAVLMPMSAHALKLSDLIKKPPQLFVPSQVIPGTEASFTLQGKAGKSYLLMLSARSQGKELPNGTALRVGKSQVEQEGVIPESGVVEIKVMIPDKVASYEKQYVEAVVWSQPDMSDAEPADVVTSVTTQNANNLVLVGKHADPGSTLIVPGDPSVSGIFRSLGTMGDVAKDPRKQTLVDDGRINRNRQLDRNLINAPGGTSTSPF